MNLLSAKNARILSRLALVTASFVAIANAKAANFNARLDLVEPTTEGGNDWAVFNSNDFSLVSVVNEAEQILVSGTTPAKLPGDEGHSVHWGALLESDGTTLSDILRLTIENGKTGQDAATVTFEMWSDGAAGWNAALAALPSNAPKMKETGLPQDVAGGFLFPDTSGKLQIFVTSDLEADGVPPEGSLPDGGATMVLLGGGVSALALLRRKLS